MNGKDPRITEGPREWGSKPSHSVEVEPPVWMKATMTGLFYLAIILLAVVVKQLAWKWLW